MTRQHRQLALGAQGSALDVVAVGIMLDSSAPNPLDRLRPLVAVRGTLLVGERVVSYEDI